MLPGLEATFVQIFQLLRQRCLAGRHLVRIDLLALFLQYVGREAVTRFTKGPEHLRLLGLQRTQPGPTCRFAPWSCSASVTPAAS